MIPCTEEIRWLFLFICALPIFTILVVGIWHAGSFLYYMLGTHEEDNLE